MLIYEVNKKGFTLAEVLITLLVIGVLAMLTIPALLSSYKKSVIETKLKQSYSIISNVLQLIQANEGSLNDIFPSTSTPANTNHIVETYFIPYLKVQTKCGASSGCKLFSSENLGSGRYILALDATASKDLVYMYQFLLSNGMLMAIEIKPEIIAIAVDIDGPNKGPAKIAQDIFFFTMRKSGSGHCVDRGWNDVYCNHGILTGGLNSYEVHGFSLSTSTADCKSKGNDCAAAIMDNHWKIIDDYPIKF